MTERLAALSQARWFSNAVLVAILVAGAIAGLETVPSMVASWGPLLARLNELVTLIFVVEIVVKIGANGTRPWNFFRDGWNVFDFVIVATAFLPLHAEYVTVLRLARLLRFFRLVRTLPRLQIIVGALLKSIPSMGYVALLLSILFYIYGILAVSLFSTNDPFHFGDLLTAGLTLFGCATGEGWVDVMYTQMYGCDVYPAADMPCTTPVAQPVAGALYFVSFMMFGAMVTLNLLVGVLLNGMEETAKENEDLDRAERGDVPSLGDELTALTESLQQIHTQLDRIKDRVKDEIEAR